MELALGEVFLDLADGIIHQVVDQRARPTHGVQPDLFLPEQRAAQARGMDERQLMRVLGRAAVDRGDPLVLLQVLVPQPEIAFAPFEEIPQGLLGLRHHNGVRHQLQVPRARHRRRHVVQIVDRGDQIFGDGDVRRHPGALDLMPGLEDEAAGEEAVRSLRAGQVVPEAIRRRRSVKAHVVPFYLDVVAGAVGPDMGAVGRTEQFHQQSRDFLRRRVRTFQPLQQQADLVQKEDGTRLGLHGEPLEDGGFRRERVRAEAVAGARPVQYLRDRRLR